MDRLKECAMAFQNLIGKDYYYALENDFVFKTFFAKKHFYHLLGLNKLADILPLKIDSNNSPSHIYNHIVDSTINYEMIKKSSFINKIQDRIDNFNNIENMMFEKAVINFDKSKFPSKLKSDIILFQDKEKFYLHLCLAPDNKIYYPETFLVEYTDNYLRNQDILRIREFQVIDIKSNDPVYHHIYYIGEPDQYSKEAAITIDGKGGVKMDNKIDEIMKKLESSIRDTMNSEKYRAFLKVQSQFHGYSFNNAILIYLQRPDATRVAGYKSWEKFGRHVIKGEKGIGILAPSPYKYEKIIEKLEPKTREVKQEKITVEGINFRKVTVFDIKQTYGKELPSICNELQGNSINAESIIKFIKQLSEVPIIEKDIYSGAKGYYSRKENLIALKKDMSLDQTAKTLIHEYAHSKLHNTEATASLDRATKEVQAESVAYIVSDRFGIDTSEYSFEYLANWSSGKELKELKESFSLIQKTADKIINDIENVITKELELQVVKEANQINIAIEGERGMEMNNKNEQELKQNQGIGGKFTMIKNKVTALEKLIDGRIKADELNNKRFDDKVKHINYNYARIRIDNQIFKIAHEMPAKEFDKWYENLSEEKRILIKNAIVNENCKFDIKQLESGIRENRETLQYCEGDKDLITEINGYIKDYEKRIDLLRRIDNKDISMAFDKVVSQYSKEFPAIKHIPKDTAVLIDQFNQERGKNLTIKEIQQLYKEAGKRLELKDDAALQCEFNKLSQVINDIKCSQLKEKETMVSEKDIQKNLNRSNVIEME